MIVDDGNKFVIADRDVGLPYGVPVIQSGPAYGNNVPTAVDIMPRGNPDDMGANGMTWLDLCNADLQANPDAKVECLRHGIFKDGHAVIGTKAYNGGVGGPVDLIVNGQVKGVLSSDGLEIFGKVKATSFEGAPLPDDPGEVWSYNFTGINYETLNIPPSGQGGFSYAFWIKGSQNSRVDILTQANGYNSPGWYGLLFNVASPSTIAWYEGMTAKISASVPWNDGEDHYVEISRSGSTLRLFIDGQIAGQASTSYNYGAAGIMARLGKPSYAGVTGFMGKVDDFVISSMAFHTEDYTPPPRQN